MTNPKAYNKFIEKHRMNLFQRDDQEIAKRSFEAGYNAATPEPKNKKQWEKSGLSLHDFLQPGDEISEGLHNYIGGATSPQYCSRTLTQMGEATREEGGVLFYMTAQVVGDKYLYLGVLPEFKQ